MTAIPTKKRTHCPVCLVWRDYGELLRRMKNRRGSLKVMAYGLAGCGFSTWYGPATFVELANAALFGSQFNANPLEFLL